MSARQVCACGADIFGSPEARSLSRADTRSIGRWPVSGRRARGDLAAVWMSESSDHRGAVAVRPISSVLVVSVGYNPENGGAGVEKPHRTASRLSHPPRLMETTGQVERTVGTCSATA